MPAPRLAAGVFFHVVVTGDPGLTEAAYPFVRDTLDRLLVRRLPGVNVGFPIRDAAGRLAEWYATERRLFKSGVVVGGRDDQAVEVLRALPHAVVVFSTGDRAERRLAELARERGVAVRVVDLAGVLEGAGARVTERPGGLQDI